MRDPVIRGCKGSRSKITLLANDKGVAKTPLQLFFFTGNGEGFYISALWYLPSSEVRNPENLPDFLTRRNFVRLKSRT